MGVLQRSALTAETVLRLFRMGYDTLRIARQFGVPEHVVYNLLARARG